VKEHNEKLEALAELDKEEELPDAHLRVKGRGRCRPGLKDVRGTCVLKETPVSLALNNNVSQALDKVRNRLLNRRGAK
jgi:hypothetical protein